MIFLHHESKLFSIEQYYHGHHNYVYMVFSILEHLSDGVYKDHRINRSYDIVITWPSATDLYCSGRRHKRAGIACSCEMSPTVSAGTSGCTGAGERENE